MNQIYFKKQPETYEKDIDRLEEERNKLEYDIRYFNDTDNFERIIELKKIKNQLEFIKDFPNVWNQFLLLQPNMTFINPSIIYPYLDIEKVNAYQIRDDYVSLPKFLNDATYIGKRGFRFKNVSNEQMSIFGIDKEYEVLYSTPSNILIRKYDISKQCFKHLMLNQNINQNEIVEYGSKINEYEECKYKGKIFDDIYYQVTTEIKRYRK